MPIEVTPTPAEADFATATTPQEFARLMQLTPEAAVRYMQGRDKMEVTYGWQELWQGAHARAFTVSRLTQADVLNDLYQALVRSVEGDLSRKDWMRDAKQLLEKSGWWGTSEVINPDTGEIVKTRFDARRLDLIFDVNTRTAYAAGKWERIEQTKKTFGYLRYITRDDGRVRPLHKSWHGVVLPVDHPFWNTHYPPNGWRCRCRVIAMREKDVQKALKAQQDNPSLPPVLHITTDAPNVVYRDWLNKHTGNTMRVPEGIDPGWAYNVGKSGAKVAQQRQTQKLAELHPVVRRQVQALAVAPMGVRSDLAVLPPVTVVEVPPTSFGAEATKAQLMTAATAHLKTYQDNNAPLTNEDTGWVLSINKLAVKKMGANQAQSVEELRAVSSIAELARYAKRVETHGDTRHNNPLVGAVHRLYVPLQIGDVLYRVKLTVKEYLDDKSTPKMALHALEALTLEIEGAPSLGAYPNYSSTEVLQTNHLPLDRRTLSIEQLLQGAKLEDGTPLATVIATQKRGQP